RPEPLATATADTTTSSRSAPPHIAAVNSAVAGQLPALETGQPASGAPAEAGGAREDSVAATRPTGIAASSVSHPLSPMASPSETEISAQPSLGEERDSQLIESREPIDSSSSTEAKAADSPDLEAASRRLIEELERRYGGEKAEPRRPGS
ncbi:MAG: hypothetical protein M3072_12890, partial [Candidatus Dormibacteraeota bacterium]|nr:hypothetical protein [Candidatus Dormibacteraeota bacterium]